MLLVVIMFSAAKILTFAVPSIAPKCTCHADGECTHCAHDEKGQCKKCKGGKMKGYKKDGEMKK